MVKAWLIIFMFWHSPNDFSLEDRRYMGKIEVPYSSVKACIKAKTDLNIESEDLGYRFICVTDDHHSGRRQDQNIPLD